MNNPNPRYSKAELDNHSNQMNSNNETYWSSRGITDDDDDWYDSQNYDSGDYDDDKFYDENYSADGWDSSDY